MEQWIVAGPQSVFCNYAVISGVSLGDGYHTYVMDREVTRMLAAYAMLILALGALVMVLAAGFGESEDEQRDGQAAGGPAQFSGPGSGKGVPSHSESSGTMPSTR